MVNGICDKLAPYERVCNASVQSFPNQVDGHISICESRQ